MRLVESTCSGPLGVHRFFATIARKNFGKQIVTIN
jgi:hypothetical protein